MNGKIYRIIGNASRHGFMLGELVIEWARLDLTMRCFHKYDDAIPTDIYWINDEDLEEIEL